MDDFYQKSEKFFNKNHPLLFLFLNSLQMVMRFPIRKVTNIENGKQVSYLKQIAKRPPKEQSSHKIS